ncbi:MAG TPA: M13 family metallopeptidase [Pyrinomonadaceae bacterium]|nr:M13 family metallopeptidase [Pyrinomonadaceae bacterium]
MNFLRKVFSFLMLLSMCMATMAQYKAFDTARMDSGALACDNFYQYTNGTWLKNTEIPPAFSSWGTWDILGTSLRERSRDILETAAKNTSAAKGSSLQLIGDYYASCMDLDAIEAAGAKPIEPFLKEIDALKDAKDLRKEIAMMHRRGVQPVFGFFIFLDEKDSTTNIANVGQGGLGLPTRDHYTNTDEKSKELRDKYTAHVARMFGLLGDNADQAKANADTVLKMETRLALASKTPVELREPEGYYHKMPVAEANKLMPGFSWEEYGKEVGAAKFDTINIGQPAFFTEAAKMMSDVSIADWKTYLRWNVVNAAAGSLSKAFDDANFDFYNRTLSGQKEQLPRWRRCTRATDNSLGEALGEEFVKTNFTPAAKQRMNELIDNLFAAYKEHINKVDWMSEDTRKQALVKLAAIKRKIGYPDKMRGYAGLTIDRKSYFDNDSRLGEFFVKRNLKDLGMPPDATRWGMTAATLNAQYSSNFNDITFPAGILQPPFFDFKADDAINYGAIGAVIGHELTHGFDDSGSLYDAAGNLKMWWTDADRKKFEEKADCVTKQFDAYEPEKGVFINGQLTLGENLADLGGLSIAYDAMQKSMQGKPRPEKIDGFTPEQRFFFGWGQVWSGKYRPELTRLLIQSDPHSIPEFRVNGPLANMTEFSQAFGCKVGDKMMRDKPCRVW